MPLKTSPEGTLPLSVVEEAMGPDVAAIMLTNPNTLGVFERDIKAIAKVVHDGGGLVYMDGANMNALLGVASPASMGIDVMHLNLHKTFATPHGGGGPGAGPVACVSELEPYLPKPVLVGKGPEAHWDYDRPKSIGKLRSFHGNFGMLLRAHSYMTELGSDGLWNVGRHAIIAANYVRAGLKDAYALAYDVPSMHEAVFTDFRQKEHGVTTHDIAKRLIDYGFHPPTVYFPLIAPGAMMIEPTETENRETLDHFIAAMRAIDLEINENPESLHDAPVQAPARRFDEATAARKPMLRYRKPEPVSPSNEE